MSVLKENLHRLVSDLKRKNCVDIIDEHIERVYAQISV
jgi:hypothetical protein